MKVAIITLTGDNYGNRLQNFAVQKLLEKRGFEVETLNNPFEKEFNFFVHWIKNSVKYLLGNKEQKAVVSREYNFLQFDKKNICFSNLWINKRRHIKKIIEKYSIFVCGSDQVWNPTSYNIGGDNFAYFAKEKVRISLSASFGITDFPKEREQEYKNYLEGFSAISVREKSGARIIQKLLGREPEVLIDPVLCLDKEDWINLEQKPKFNINKPYILIYTLGTINPEMEEYILGLESKGYYGLRLMNKKDIENYSINPSEFLYLIHHASGVITDSFHGTILSYLYDKPVSVFVRRGDRVSMNTRIENLLQVLSLQDRVAKEINVDNFFTYDYSSSKKVLQEERMKVNEFLDGALRKYIED